MVAITITRPLVQRFGPPAQARPVDWQGGSGFRFPGALWVCLHPGNDQPTTVIHERISRTHG
jgi:hypothetical protein